jgi:hypothetical protein
MRIMTVAPEDARGVRRLVVAVARRRYGGVVPGIFRVGLVDLRLGVLVDRLYAYLHLRRRSPLTRLQREMLATVVNGKVGGAP